MREILINLFIKPKINKFIYLLDIVSIDRISLIYLSVTLFLNI